MYGKLVNAMLLIIKKKYAPFVLLCRTFKSVLACFPVLKGPRTDTLIKVARRETKIIRVSSNKYLSTKTKHLACADLVSTENYR